MRLASGEADLLAGRYIDVADDVDALVAQSEEIATRNIPRLTLSRPPHFSSK